MDHRTASRVRIAHVSIALIALILTPQPSLGREEAPLPTGITRGDRLVDLDAVPVREAPPVDLAAAEGEDREREAAGLPPRFAIPNAVEITPETAGLWEAADTETAVWRLRLRSPGALSLNLGFSRFRMPESGRLLVYAADLSQILGPYTADDNRAHGELWTPALLTDELVVELTVPAGAQDVLELKLSSINVGYRGFGDTAGPLSGACNVDVVCPDGDAWRNEIASVGVFSRGGSLLCTGFMINNTNQDRTPYFVTANHCGMNATNAPSLVVYWNYQASTCGGTRDGQLNQSQSGSTWLASYAPSDFTIVLLDKSPDAEWGVTFAGWDRSGQNAPMAVTVHHPRTDEKAISYENDQTTTTSYLQTSSPGDGTHVRVEDWDTGTTEPGSSGAPLFDQNHHVIGQLHGGYAACGNDAADWYGKLSVSWSGGGTPSTRLSDWLDPGDTGVTSLDTLAADGCDFDGSCDLDESCLSCPADCISGTAVAVCGDNLCEIEQEDCVSCPTDCNAETGGPPSSQYCCGSDADCSDERCSDATNTCSSEPRLAFCCGDSVCEGEEDSDNCAVDCVGCGDALCDPGSGEDSCSCPADCGSPPPNEAGTTCTDGVDNDCDEDLDCADQDCAGPSAPDGDGDGRYYCGDCDDADNAVWATPSVVDSLAIEAGGAVSWSIATDPGAASVAYDLLRVDDPSDFANAVCLATKVATTSTLDPDLPAAGTVYYYLARAVNDCPVGGAGPVGTNSAGFPRAAPTCP